MNNRHKSLHKQALGLFKANRMQEALALYKQLCSRDAGDIQAWHMAGAIAGITGDYSSAKIYCKKVIALNPHAHGPHLNLANALLAMGQHEEAMRCFQRALQLKPGDPQTLTNLASLHMKLGQFKAAEKCLKSVINTSPGHVEAQNNLGNLYRETGMFAMAESCFQEALKIKPDYVDALCNLGSVLSDQLKFEESKAAYTKALRLAPESHLVLRNLGNLHQSTGNFDKARKCYEDALKQNPSDIATLSSLSSLHERCGNSDVAFTLLDPMIRSRQYDADAALTYAKICSKRGDDEAGIQLLTETLKTSGNSDKAVDIHFALGELHDRSGHYERAFHFFQKANELDGSRQGGLDYVEYLERITGFYTRQRALDLARSTIDSELPIFIVGMPRTGTSLVEQILSSHPQVNAGGERSDIFSIISSLERGSNTKFRYPELVETLTPESLNDIATQHLMTIGRLSENSVRFTDKTPLHGIHLGFINQLLPNSRIIICERNALDTCLSIYFHRFNAFHSYANSMDTLGSLYRKYYQLMQHWMDILDLKIMRIQYESLVHEPEMHIRSIIDFCDLDWDSSCLDFYKNKRTVNTPSYDQVRKPMYTDSVDRWKHYENFLGPLRDSLAT